MRLASPLGILIATVLLCLPASAAPATNEGLEDLDRATELQLKARSLDEFGRVAELCDSALRKGLDEGNSQLAKQLLAAALYQRAKFVGDAVLEARTIDRRSERLRRMALADLEKGLAHCPQMADAQFLAAQLQALPGGDRDKALKAVNEAIRLFQEDNQQRSKALVLRAQLTEDLKRKQADYDQAVEADPANASAWLGRAMFYLEQGEHEKAASQFAKLLEQDATNVMALFGAAEALAQLGKNKQALEYLDKAVELEPKAAAGYMSRARVYLLMDDSNRALADVERVLQLQPNYPPAILLRSMISAEQKKLSAAIADIQLLLRGDPQNVELRLQLARYYYVDKRLNRAIGEYAAVLVQEPDNWQALRGRGDALLSVGQQAEAIKDYKAALKVQPDESGLLNNLAWVLATSPDEKLRDGKRSIELAKKACEITEYKQAHILSTLAAGYAETNDFETAIQWSTKAVELGDDDVKEQLQKELESYQQKKPWRELQQLEEQPLP